MIKNEKHLIKTTIELSSQDLYCILMGGEIRQEFDDNEEILIYCDHPQETRKKYDDRTRTNCS